LGKNSIGLLFVYPNTFKIKPDLAEPNPQPLLSLLFHPLTPLPPTGPGVGTFTELSVLSSSVRSPKKNSQ